MNKKTVTIIVLTVQILINANANANINEKPSIEESTPETIVVTANKYASKISETSSAVSVISAKKLTNTKSSTLAENLNTVSGVYMADLKNEEHSMAIRQPNSTNAVYSYLQDGVAIRPVGVFNHNSLYEINKEAIGSIEVQKGPSSALYGNNGVGGTVNFLTKDITNNDFDISAQLSDDNKYRFVASKSLMPDNVYIDIGVNHKFRLDAYATLNRNNDIEHSRADKFSINAKHTWQLNPSTKIINTYSHNYLETPSHGSKNQTEYDSGDFTKNKNTFTYRKVNSGRWLTDISGNWNKNGDTHMRLFARTNITNQLPSYSIIDKSSINGTITGKTNFQSFNSIGADIYHKQKINDKLDILLGGTFDYTPNFNSHEDALSITKDSISQKYTSYKYTGVLRDYKASIQNQAIYSQINYMPIKDVNINAGLRYDNIVYNYQNNLTPSSITGAPSESKNFENISPKIGIIWKINPRLNIFSNYSYGFVPPEISSLYGSRANVPNLKSAIFKNIDIGARFKLPYKIKGDIAVYRLNGKDEQLNYSQIIGYSIPVNAGKTSHQGIELALNQDIDKFDWRVSATYAQHKYLTYNVSPTVNFSDKDNPQAPKIFANTEIGFKPNTDWRLSLQNQYLSSYYINNANTENIKYKGHSIFNLSINYDSKKYSAWLKVNNLFDTKYAQSASSTYNSGVYKPNEQNSYNPGSLRAFVLGISGKF
jgi:iron complex outermembrane recepter protein